MKKEKQNYIIKSAEYFWKELEEIEMYMLENLYQNTFLKFLELLTFKLSLLIAFPKMYIEYDDNKKYRRFVVKNYVVFYKVDEENQIIHIVHIYYGRKVSFNLR